MKDKFLPPPLPVVYSSTGIEWAKDDKEASYLSLFQNIALNGSLLPKHANTKFPKGVLYDYPWPSTKDNLTDRVCMYCGLYFGNIKSKQNHSSYCQTKESRAVGDEQHSGRIARRRKELLCAMAFQELEWHAADDVDFIDSEADIQENVHENRTPVLCGIEPVWTSDWQ